MMWDLILFDCDGVLVDSEPIADRIFPEVLAAEGIVIPQDEVRELFTGYSLKSCLERIEERLGAPVPVGLPRKYYDRLFAEFEKSLKPVPGIIEVLNLIPYPFCVASSGEHEKMRVTLGITGLLPKFTGRMFSATGVAHGKPAPDLFLYAAEKCGADPKKCAVVEDSMPGIKAAVAAGMAAFAYVNSSDPKTPEPFKQNGAVVFNAMKNLPGLLKSADNELK